MLHLIGELKRIQDNEAGAIGWLIIGVILGVVLVIWLIAKIIGGIF